jgi:hypothetical protein
MLKLAAEKEEYKTKYEHNIRASLDRGRDYQERINEVTEKLTNFLDSTRAEALNNYRKGLQDGISMAQVKPIAFVEPKPIKTMDEYASEIVENKEQIKASKAYDEGLAAIMSYDGNLPKEE